MDPKAVAALNLTQRFYSALGGQLMQMNIETFKGKDDAETVEVEINGHGWLLDLHIEDGLLRLGPEVVADRIMEALQNAQKAQLTVNESDVANLTAGLQEIARLINEP